MGLNSLPSKIELHIEQRRKSLEDARDPKRFNEAVRAFLQASYAGACELDRLWKLLVGETYRCRYTVLSPGLAFDVDPRICIWSRLDTGIRFTSMEITLNTAAFDIEASLYYADDFIARANEVLVRSLSTTAGVLSVRDLRLRVPLGKSLYITFGSRPDDAISQVAFDLRYVR